MAKCVHGACNGSGFPGENAIHALQFGVKMETVQALIIKNK